MLKKVKIGKIIGYYTIKLPIDVLILGLLSLISILLWLATVHKMNKN